MDIVLDKNEQNLSKILCVRDKKGQIRLTVGLVVTVFFENQQTKAVRQDVADVAQGYIEMVGEGLRWGNHPNTRKPHPMGSRYVKFPREWLPEHPDGEAWEFAFHGGEEKEAASSFQLASYGSSYGHDGGLGYLSMAFPLTWFADRSETFPTYVHRVCKRMRPLSGYGGIGLLESLYVYTREEYQAVVRPIADRFPGMEIENRVGHKIHMRQGIKGVNWLTILGDRWINEMGGLDYLRARLGEEFGFYAYDGGVVLQAGPKPELGDAKANRWPRLYVTLAKVLKKIQIKDHYPMHFAGEGRLDYEATKAWIFRFDDR